MKKGLIVLLPIAWIGLSAYLFTSMAQIQPAAAYRAIQSFFMDSGHHKKHTALTFDMAIEKEKSKKAALIDIK